MPFSCYCLVSETGSTYVGFTVDVDRRLRQHNGELVGGARATKGKSWKRILTVTGFPTQRDALQFEWKWKFVTRKTKGATAVERRGKALVQLLTTETSTSKATPFSMYEDPLLILVDDPCVKPWIQDKEMKYGLLIE
jgi:predicted GIY-YIG superfamily endonuclease